jgi:hypothetical protein
MANTDPVSGLMASMSRIRGRRPEGTATQGTTAQQAGTILPVVRPATPVAMPPVSMPIAAPAPTTENPLIAAVRPSQPLSPIPQGNLTQPLSQREIVAQTAGQVLLQEPDATLAQAYILGLGYIYGVPKSTPGVPTPMSVPNEANPSQSIPLA